MANIIFLITSIAWLVITMKTAKKVFEWKANIYTFSALLLTFSIVEFGIHLVTGGRL